MEIPYSDIRNQICTGSVLLFDGKGHISNIIKAGTFSDKSHVALAIRGADFAALFPDQAQGLDASRVLCFESTMISECPDVNDDRVKGVQTAYLSERLKSYAGAVSVRILERRPTWNELEALAEFYAAMSGRPYEQSIKEMILAAYDGPLGENEANFDTLFCSELGAGAWQAMDYLDEPPAGRPANEYVPGDFNRDLILRNGQSLGAEIQLT